MPVDKGLEEVVEGLELGCGDGEGGRGGWTECWGGGGGCGAGGDVREGAGEESEGLDGLRGVNKGVGAGKREASVFGKGKS